MTLFLVLAADAVSAAIVSGRQRHLIFAGIWVGIAFQAKMLEAWLVLPAFGLAYLFGRNDGWANRLRKAAVGGLVAGVVSLSWMTIVTLTPATDRPYVDGSQHNSVYEQVFVYNGFGRTNQQTGFAGLAGLLGSGESNGSRPTSGNGSPPAWNRLIQGDVGRDTGWLLPAALAVGVAGLFTRRRSYFILWTGWLVAMVAVFSDVFTFHSYYTAGLSPPIAAILGAGIASLWESRAKVRAVAARRGAVTALIVAGTVAYGIWLTRSSGSDTRGWWLWPVAVSLGAVAVVLLLASAVAWPHRTILAAALAVGTAAILVIPASGTAQIVAKQRGFGDTPFETAETAAANAVLAGSKSKRLVQVLPRLEKLQSGSPYVMAVSTSAVAAGFISATGKEILPIGGFTGTIPEPTISQLAGMVRAGKFHLALLIGGFHDPGLNWIASHCRHLVRRGGTIDLFICTPNDAPAAPG
jgi:4-amino-4-deoxy-L-arabinose transferase-like glycosyltransferase